MFLRKSRVPVLSREIVEGLIKKKYILGNVNKEELLKRIEEILETEFRKDEELNEDVRSLLSKYEREIERGMVDYRKLFEMTKRRLAKERNIVL
ncbi:MAG: DUF507 family protein [Nitrospirae bacterium]|nr:MAG: DUF507 family protein [Nitrospirota bacterium]